jgi:hypothetical protein
MVELNMLVDFLAVTKEWGCDFPHSIKLNKWNQCCYHDNFKSDTDTAENESYFGKKNEVRG